MHIKLLSPAAFLSPKCSKYRLAAGLCAVSSGGAYSAPPDPLVGLNGPTSKGRKGGGEKEEGRGMGGREGDGKGRGGGRKGMERRKGGGGAYELNHPSP